ncbi:MAG: hypothetical protein AB7O96_18970 [Pseudobdellovibrionaceae bacterium]
MYNGSVQIDGTEMPVSITFTGANAAIYDGPLAKRLVTPGLNRPAFLVWERYGGITGGGFMTKFYNRPIPTKEEMEHNTIPVEYDYSAINWVDESTKEGSEISLEIRNPWNSKFATIQFHDTFYLPGTDDWSPKKEIGYFATLECNNICTRNEITVCE